MRVNHITDIGRITRLAALVHEKVDVVDLFINANWEKSVGDWLERASEQELVNWLNTVLALPRYAPWPGNEGKKP